MNIRFLLAVFTFLSIASFAASGYRLVKTIPIPGDGSWDYVTADSVNRRVYISHGIQMDVLDADSGAIAGRIPAPEVDPSNKSFLAGC